MMRTVVIPILIGAASCAIFSFLSLLFFDVERLKSALFSRFGLKFYKSFDRVRSREQVVRLFHRLFVSYKVDKGGRILLMSNTGGYPEFNPYVRITELAAHDNVEIFLAVVRSSMAAYYAHHPETTRKLARSGNIRLFVFDDLVPYHFRIGLNTDLGVGFFCAYYGHANNKVDLEGIVSSHPLMLEAVESLYHGLLGSGVEVTEANLNILAA